MDDDVYMECGGYYGEVIAAPAVQIVSVCVDTNCGDGRPAEIYGSIRAADGPVTKLLYSREEDNCETIHGFGKLPISDSPMLGDKGVVVDVCLKDRTKGIELIKQQHYLDFSADNIDQTYDILKRVPLGKEGNIAYLYYIAFQFAVFATVKVTVIKKGNETAGKEVNVTNFYGSIVASYGNNKRYCKNEDDLKYLETHLFDKSSHEAALTTGGTPIALSRSVVAVPAYSSLVIKVDLFESGKQLFRGALRFAAHHCRDVTKRIESEIGCVKVDVQWSTPYVYMQKERKSVIDNCTGATEPSNKIQRVRYRSANDKWKAVEWVEIFSVCIGGIAGDVSTLSGSIEVRNFDPPKCIFNRDRDDPEVLPNDKVLYIEEVFPIAESHVDADLILHDPNNNLEVCRGRMSWSEQRQMTGPICWSEKRLCSVLRGADGYAAVHCMLFSSAVKATIEATFFCDGSSTDSFSSVCGVVFAWYGGHPLFSTSTNYKKKYYRSRLFSKPRNKPMDLMNSGSKIPLSKSAVAVPRESSLIVGVDLKVIDGGNSKEEANICGDVEFMIDLSSTVCKEIQVGSYRIAFSVKFTDWNAEYGVRIREDAGDAKDAEDEDDDLFFS